MIPGKPQVTGCLSMVWVAAATAGRRGRRHERRTGGKTGEGQAALSLCKRQLRKREKENDTTREVKKGQVSPLKKKIIKENKSKALLGEKTS